jgi:hypothetical protein
MTEPEDRLRGLLRAALPRTEDSASGRDLWPEVARGVGEPVLHVSWPDWTLAALALIWLLAFRETIPALLYHL